MSVREATYFRLSRARVPPHVGAGVMYVMVTCVDTDVSFTVELMGVVPVLMYFGKTYVRGYDGYTVTVSVVVIPADCMTCE